MTQLTFGFLCWPLGQHNSTNLLVLMVPVAHSFIQAFSHSLFHCESPLDLPRRSNQSILKEINPEYSFRRTDAEAEAEAPIL